MRLTREAIAREQRAYPVGSGESRNVASLNTLDALSLRLRGVQLHIDRAPDARSVGTSCVSYEPTWHARDRQSQRLITQREVQACFKRGVSCPAGSGRMRYEHQGVVVIATREKVVITTWRKQLGKAQAADRDASRAQRRAVAQLSKMCLWAFRVWRRFPAALRHHVAWLLERVPHALLPPPRDARRRTLRLHFGAWRMLLEIAHNERVTELLELRGPVARHRARATVARRAAFVHWRTHAGREAAFRAAAALTSRYVAAYRRCDARRALRQWRECRRTLSE